MKIGLQIGNYDWAVEPENGAEVLKEIGRAAEKAGFSSIFVMDHFYQLEPMIGKADDPMLEAYNVLGFLAGQTKRVKLGTLVSGNLYRNPGHLIKSVVTLDLLSRGRAYYGVGTGWYEREALGLGFGFPDWDELFDRLEETLQISKQMFSGSREAFKGRYYHMAEPILSPMPVSKPYPPILIGGEGEKRTIPLVARFGDACNFFAFGDNEKMKHKLHVLKKECQKIGRDYDDIEKTAMTMALVGSGGMPPDSVVQSAKELGELGIDHLIYALPNDGEITPLEVFEDEIIPALSG